MIYLNRLEIERGPSFLKFKRKLNREEIALLCERLWNFRSIVPDAEDNHINFAIGDALGEYSKQFGEDEGELFVKGWTRLSKLRDNMLRDHRRGTDLPSESRVPNQRVLFNAQSSWIKAYGSGFPR